MASSTTLTRHPSGRRGRVMYGVGCTRSVCLFFYETTRRVIRCQRRLRRVDLGEKRVQRRGGEKNTREESSQSKK